MSFVHTTDEARLVRLWCDDCVPVYSTEEDRTYQSAVCPMCKVATENLHPDDGLCPECEEEWVDLCEDWLK